MCVGGIWSGVWQLVRRRQQLYSQPRSLQVVALWAVSGAAACLPFALLTPNACTVLQLGQAREGEEGGEGGEAAEVERMGLTPGREGRW